MPHVDLLELPYFQGISMDALVALVDLMEPRTFEPGATIVTEGDVTPQSLFIATSGRVVVSKRTPDGRERNLAELDSPTLFGEIELFCEIPAVATARAASPVSAFALTRHTFVRLFEAKHPGLMLFIFNVARVSCHRLAVSDELLAQVLEGEDLVEMRRAVFARRSASDSPWPRTTGAFRLPGPVR